MNKEERNELDKRILENRRTRNKFQELRHTAKAELDRCDAVLEVIEDILQGNLRERYGVVAVIHGARGDRYGGESWTNWALFDGWVTDDQIDYYLNWCSDYRGPGGVYEREPYIRRTKTRVLVTQDAGLDI